MPWGSEVVVREWDALKAAPIAFVVLVAAAFASGFAVGAKWRDPEIAAKDTYIEDLKVTSEQLHQLSKTAADAAPQYKTLTWTKGIGPSKSTGSQDGGGVVVDALRRGGWTAIYAEPSYSTTYTVPDNAVALEPNTPEGLATVKKALTEASIPYSEHSTNDGKRYLTVPQYDYYDAYTSQPSSQPR